MTGFYKKRNTGMKWVKRTERTHYQNVAVSDSVVC